jgi:DNA-directed RNA polymerase subunit F
MTTLAAVGAVWILSLVQAGGPQEDPSERLAQRLREALQLSEEQAAKVREILKKQGEELRAVLTDEQRQRYDQMSRFLGGFGGRGGGAPPWAGGFRGAWLPSTEELKAQLDLNDDQVSRINAIRDGVREEIRNFWRNRQGGGNPAEEWTAWMQKAREETLAKVRETLTDSQKAKFDEILKNFQSEGRVETGDRNRDRGRGGSAEDRVSRAMDALRIEDAQEAAAIRGLVKKVVDLMERLEDAQRDARRKVEEALRAADLSDEALGERLEELRKGVRELEKELAGARKELSEVVTNRQELELVRRGILR